MPHPDLAAEQAHLDAATDALAAMAERTTAALADTASAATEVDGEVAAFHLRRRLADLAARDDALAFGRIDDDDGRWYVGRRHVEDDAGDALVVDWRAPVAVPFYRATVHDPVGLHVRRRFLTEGRTLTDILEEDFDDPDGALVSGGVPDPLLAELERARTGSMRDIVATIASEQDEVIRTPLDRLLVVQGGPGTGKTVVALHRAAYLLFEHRLQLLDAGVLVVGPNPLFLRYVADVLPSLGETAVRQTTVEGLRPPGIRVAAGVPVEPDVGRVWGDARMAAVVDAAVRDRIRVPTEPVAIHTPRGTVRLAPDQVAEAVEEVLARRVPHATGREALRNQLLHVAYDDHARIAEVPAHKADFLAAARSDAGVKRFLDQVWPPLSAPALVQRLVTSPAARRRAAAGILDASEADLLARDLPRKVGEIRWLAAEVPVLDEAEARIVGSRAAYGHVIADEAQDLSAMALRALARRAPSGSLTVVGDLAQATTAWAQPSWDAVVEVLAGPAPVERAELTVGYRTPAPILDLANRLLPTAAPGVTPARSVRRTGRDPVRIPVAGDGAVALADAVVRWLDDPDHGPTGRGTVAVVATAAHHDALRAQVLAAGAEVVDGPAGRAGDEGSGRRVALLTPLLAKGLEFDHVAVVEPVAIVEAEPAGARALFVACTRATRTLALVHARPLPAGLT